jgi:hypothetical protein
MKALARQLFTGALMRSLICIAALLILPASLPAQWQQGTPVVSAAHRPRYYTAAEEALAAVRARLRELVEAQDAYFLAHQTYTTNLSALHLPTPEKSGSLVVLHVTHAGGRAWRATGRHADLRAKSCVIFVGDVEGLPLPATNVDHRRPTPDQEGRAVCDRQ